MRGEKLLVKNSTTTDSQPHKYNLTKKSRSSPMRNLNDILKKVRRGTEETATPTVGTGWGQFFIFQGVRSNLVGRSFICSSK